MSDRLTMFLGALLLPLLAIGQAASEVPVTSVSTALPGSPTWSATAPFNTLVTRDMDPITGQLGAAVPRNFTHNISAFGSGGANQYAEPVGSYSHSLTPANTDITVVGTFSLGRHYRIDFTIPEQAFPTAMGAEATYTIAVTFTHSPAGQSITHTELVGSITLRNGAANNSGNPPTPPTPTPPTPTPPTPTPPTPAPPTTQTPSPPSIPKPNAIVGWSRWPFGFLRGNKPPPPVVPMSVSNNRPVLQNRNTLRRMLRIGLRPF